MAQYKIIIDHSKVSANLTDFPVYVDLANFPADFWDTVSEGGGDIRCYDVLGNELAREVVSCDTALKSGELHIKANLFSTKATVLMINVDGTSSDYAPTDLYGRNAVWSNGYIGVWHLESLVDSTGTGYDLTDNSTTIVHNSRLGNGRSGFDTGKYLTAGNPPGLMRDGQTWTLSAWGRPTNTTENNIQVLVDHGFLADRGEGIYIRNGLWVAHGRGQITSTLTAVSGEWAYAVATSSNKLFINGIDTLATDGGSTSRSTNYPFNIGYQSKSSESPDARFWRGDIDEIRISEDVHSLEWIATEYANQSSPTTFYAVEGIVQQPIPFSDGFAYIYANVGYSAPNSGQGYAYSYENVGYQAPNSGQGYAYSYENVGYNAPNSGVGYGYSYENVTLYVIDNNNMLPPIIS